MAVILLTSVSILSGFLDTIFTRIIALFKLMVGVSFPRNVDIVSRVSDVEAIIHDGPLTYRYSVVSKSLDSSSNTTGNRVGSLVSTVSIVLKHSPSIG